MCSSASKQNLFCFIFFLALFFFFVFCFCFFLLMVDAEFVTSITATGLRSSPAQPTSVGCKITRRRKRKETCQLTILLTTDIQELYCVFGFDFYCLRRS